MKCDGSEEVWCEERIDRVYHRNSVGGCGVENERQLGEGGKEGE